MDNIYPLLILTADARLKQHSVIFWRTFRFMSKIVRMGPAGVSGTEIVKFLLTIIL